MGKKVSVTDGRETGFDKVKKLTFHVPFHELGYSTRIENGKRVEALLVYPEEGEPPICYTMEVGKELRRILKTRKETLGHQDKTFNHLDKFSKETGVNLSLEEKWMIQADLETFKRDEKPQFPSLDRKRERKLIKWLDY